MATEALLNLSFNGAIFWIIPCNNTAERNQPIIVGADCIDQIFENSSVGDYQMEYESLFLIRNLARCGTLCLNWFNIIPKAPDIGRERLGEKHFKQILPKLSPQKVYKPDQVLFVALHVKFTLDHGVQEYSSASENSAGNFVRGRAHWTQSENPWCSWYHPNFAGPSGVSFLFLFTVQSFFLPMRSNSGTTWNFDILLRVLKIIDNVIQDGSNLFSLLTFFPYTSRGKQN